MRLTLKDDGFPYLKVMEGRKWIGRVFKNANGTWDCIINKQFYFRNAPTANAAFKEGGARFMGHASAEALSRHNANVATKNKAARQRVRGIAAGMMSPNREEREVAYARFFDVFLKEEK